MKRIIASLIAVAFLAGCSANSLQEAETKTRLAGAVPGGGLVYLPIWAASTVANLVTEPEMTEADKEAQRKAVEEARKRREKYLAEKAAEEAASQPSQD